MSVFRHLVVYGDIDEIRREDAERLGAASMAAWELIGVDDPVDMFVLEKAGIGSELYARLRKEGLSADDIIQRWGGP